MLTQLLTLAACVPLLLPPGVCLCKAGDRPRARAALAQARDAGPVALLDGPCCKKCQCAAPAATPSSHRGRHPTPRPAPTEDPHLPGCPASPAADASKWVEPTQTVANILPPLQIVAFLPVEVTVAARPPVPASANWPSSPPLYLSHCSLVV